MLSIGVNAVQYSPKSLVLHFDTNSSEIINILYLSFNVLVELLCARTDFATGGPHNK